MSVDNARPESSITRVGEETPKNVVDIVKARKEPPPETPQAIRTRRAVVLSFWAIVILLGLPIWWTTTTVYRASLPLQSMNEWADGKVCSPVFPLRILLDAGHLQPSESQQLVTGAQHALDDLNDFAAHHLRLSLLEANTSTVSVIAGDTGHGDTSEKSDRSPDALNQPAAALTVRLSPKDGISHPSATLHPYSPLLDIFYPPGMVSSPSSTSSMLGTFIANELQRTFAEEQDILSYLLSSGSVSVTASADARTSSVRAQSEEVLASLARRTTRSMKYAPTYHLTFSLFTPEASPSSWEVQNALQATITPLLSVFSAISNFTIDTQVQPYATFSPSVQPTYNETQKAWLLSRSDLGGFINAAEWPLSPSIGTAPTINFLLYIPSPSQSPLLVQGGSSSNSWLIPQWGGVVVYNPSNTSQPNNNLLTTHQLRSPLLTFSHQLLSLLGVPHSPPSLPLRLSTLTRLHAASLLLSASNTLGSLARLSLALPSISIPDSVLTSVISTISHLEASCQAFKAGDFPSALINGREAERQAEKAFFERSMVGQVYFPEEHKVAVYLPLLGPVAVPLVMSAVKEIRASVKAKRKTL